jgi:hypothetical protein
MHGGRASTATQESIYTSALPRQETLKGLARLYLPSPPARSSSFRNDRLSSGAHLTDMLTSRTVSHTVGTAEDSTTLDDPDH